MTIDNSFDIFRWLAVVASGVGVAPVMSWLLDKIGGFNSLEANLKIFWVCVSSAGISILAYLILRFVPSNVLTELQPIIGVVIATVATFYSMTTTKAVRNSLARKR